MIDAVLDTSRDVLINALPDVLTNEFVDISADDFPVAPYCAPLNPTLDAMLDKLLHFSLDAPPKAQDASRSEILDEVVADCCEARSGGSRSCKEGCTYASGA